MTGLMSGKRGLIMGLANDKSLAWGIARKLGEEGAELAFSYQGEALQKRVGPPAVLVEFRDHRRHFGRVRVEQPADKPLGPDGGLIPGDPVSQRHPGPRKEGDRREDRDERPHQYVRTVGSYFVTRTSL